MFKIPKAEKRINNKRVSTPVGKLGVSIEPMPVTLEEEVTITYDGLLAQNGATAIYAHLGNGNSNNWTNVQDLPLTKNGQVWSLNLIPTDSRMNFCFHDGADNWDNNFGHNWSCTIHNGQQV